MSFNADSDVAVLNKQVVLKETYRNREYRNLERCGDASWGATVTEARFDKQLNFDLFNRLRKTGIFRVAVLEGDREVGNKDVVVKADDTAGVTMVVGSESRVANIDRVEAENNCIASGGSKCSCFGDKFEAVLAKANKSLSEPFQSTDPGRYRVRVELIE